MKAIHKSRMALLALLIVASSILSCAPRRVVVVEHRPRPAKVVVVKRPARTVVVRPAPRPHRQPHRVVVVRRRR